MKQSTSLSQKLAGFASSADAQIVHVDNPDVIIGQNQQQNFDLDGDGNTDVNFGQIQSYIPGTMTTTANGTNWSPGKFIDKAKINPSLNLSIIGNPWNAYVLNINNEIKASNSFFDNPYSLSSFRGIGEKFVGIKFSGNKLGGGTNSYIGWIRISVAAGAKSITVFDWAYTAYTNPSESILAGQTTLPTSIEPSEASSSLNVSVFPTKVTDKVSISTQDAAAYIITNMTGAVVDQGVLMAGENLISTAQLTKGIYLIKVNNTNGSVVKRIVKE